MTAIRARCFAGSVGLGASVCLGGICASTMVLAGSGASSLCITGIRVFSCFRGRGAASFCWAGSGTFLISKDFSAVLNCCGGEVSVSVGIDGADVMPLLGGWLLARALIAGIEW